MAQNMSIFNCLFELCWACQDGLASSLHCASFHLLCKYISSTGCLNAASSPIQSRSRRMGRMAGHPCNRVCQLPWICYPFFAMTRKSLTTLPQPKLFVVSVACFSKFQGRDRVNCPKLAWLIFLIFVRRKLQESVLHNGLTMVLTWMVDDGGTMHRHSRSYLQCMHCSNTFVSTWPQSSDSA